MSSIGVIINPGSGRGNGKGAALRDALTGVAGVDVAFLQSFSQIVPALEGMAKKSAHTIFISSGDGTIQAVQSFIAESGHFAIAPRLCVLPHGTTNMTAADLGFKRRSVAAQAAFIANPVPRKLAQRTALRVLDAADGRVRQGMFLGCGAVSAATRYCQRAFNDKGLRGSSAAFATLAGALVKNMFGPAKPGDRDRFDRPFDIACAVDGRPLCEGQQLMVMATTLNKLVMDVKPFWGGATAPIRVTSFPYPPPSPLLRWAWAAAKGGEDRKAPPGAFSRAGSSGAMSCVEDFVIDGEFFAPPESGVVRFETGRSYTFILE